jgi:hypothetical protein
MPERSEGAVGNLAAPDTEYRRRLHQQSAHVERLTRLESRVVLLRRLFFGTVVLAALLTERESWLPKVVIVGVPAVALDRVIYWRIRVSRQRLRAARAAAFYEWRLACLNGNWAGSGDCGARYLDDDHPSALDLDLFGPGGLFELLNTTCTRTGEDTLASWLLAPAPAEAILGRQAAVAELRARVDLREELAVLRGEGPEGVGVAALTDWGSQEPTGIPTWARLVSGVLAAITLAGLVGFCGFGALPLLVVGLLILEGALALWLRPRIRPVVASIRDRDGELFALAAVFRRLEREQLTTPYVSRLRASLDAGGRPASEALTRLARLVKRLNVAPLFFPMLKTTRLALAIEAWRRRFGPVLAHWAAALGELEAVSALAGHAYENPGDPFPVIATDGPCFEGEGLSHPLLPFDRCVRNDVRLGGDLRLLVVSGSNMSGKSTLLRTVGINAVLALAGAPVRATSLRLSPLAVGATLRVQDSLQAGRSRFQAEVLRIRKLLELARGKPPLMFLLDELFQGTNSHDRRVGAEALVRQLVGAGAIGLVTTHDLALTELADHLGPYATNVHFVDDFADGAMTFDYRLRPGVVPRSNALALLRAVGIVV